MARPKTIITEGEKRKPLAHDWDRIRPLYMRGETLQYIMESFPYLDITKASIYNHMRREGSLAKKKALDQKIMDNLADAVQEQKIAVNNECIRLFNNGSKVIDGLLKAYLTEISIGDISKSKTKARATAYNIDLLMSGVTKIQKGLRVAYGMDEDGKLYEKEPEVLVIEGVDTGKI